MAHTYDTGGRFPLTLAYSGVDPTSFSITLGSGATVLWVAIAVGSTSARTGGDPTYNGITLTAGNPAETSGGTGSETTHEDWYLLNPPTGSAYTLSIPNTGPQQLTVVWGSAKAGSGYTSVLDNTGSAGATSTNPSTSFTVADGAVWFGAISTGAQTWSPTAQSGTQIADWDSGSWGTGGQYGIKSGAGSQTVSWTFGTSDDYRIQAISFKEAAVVTASPSKGDVNAVGYEATVVRVASYSGSVGNINAVSAAVGPTVTLTRTISAPDPWYGTINAVGNSGTVGYGADTTVSPSKGDVNAVGYAATVSIERSAFGLVGNVNAVGYSPTATIERTLSVTGQVGNAEAVGYAATVELVKPSYNASGLLGTAEAVGYAGSVSYGAQHNAEGLLGVAQAVGYAASVEREINRTGFVNAVSAGVGPTVEITRRIYAPDPFYGALTVAGFAGTVDRSIGTNLTFTAQVGRVDAVGYAPSTDQTFNVFAEVGYTDAVGYAATVTREIIFDALAGKVNAVGYAAAVGFVGDRTIEALAGRIVVEGYPTLVQFGQYVTERGELEAKTAQVGPTVEIVRRVEAESPFYATATAKGFQIRVDRAIGSNRTFTADDPSPVQVVGFDSTIQYYPVIEATPQVGVINAVGFAGSLTVPGVDVPAETGTIWVIGAELTPDIELITEIGGPDTGSLRTVGFAPSTNTEQPTVFNINAEVGRLDAVGYEGSVNWSKQYEAQVGVITATGEKPIDFRRPDRGDINAEGFAADIGITRVVEPRLGVVQADGSIADVLIFRGEYTRTATESGPVDAVGFAPVVDIFGRPVVRPDDGAGSGGRNYDESDAQIRAEDELIMQVITEWIKRRVA